MSSKIIESSVLHNKYEIFTTRREAGKQLASYLENFDFDILLAIPNGGLPVALGLSDKLPIPEFNLLMIRKIQLPWSIESGFGAVTIDGQLFINQRIVDYYSIPEDDVKEKINQAKKMLESRLKKYNVSSYDVQNKNVIIVDDGIASGFSMIAGVNWLHNKHAQSIVIAVPTAPLSSIYTIIKETSVSNIISLNIRDHYSFAVADAYKEWYDVSDKEAQEIIKLLQTK